MQLLTGTNNSNPIALSDIKVTLVMEKMPTYKLWVGGKDLGTSTDRKVIIQYAHELVGSRVEEF